MKNWNVNSNEMPQFDGDYLCWINELQECGAIHEYYKVVTCQNNIWLVGVLQFVKAWKELPLVPYDEKREIEVLIDTLKGLVCDVNNLLGEHDIEWQQAGYFNSAKILLEQLQNNNR